VAASPATVVLGAALIAVAATAWLLVLRAGSSMSMMGPGASPSVAEGAAFTAQWGVMMAAMMLPSAAPMILLYRTVSKRLSAERNPSIPVALFAAVYLFLWLLLGAPVYGAYVAVSSLAARWRPFDAGDAVRGSRSSGRRRGLPAHGSEARLSPPLRSASRIPHAAVA